MTLQLIIIIFFMAILLGVIAIFTSYSAVKASPNYELKRRLAKLAFKEDDSLPSDLTRELLSEITPLDRFLFNNSLYRRLDKLIDNAGYKIDTKIFILLYMFFALCVLALGVAIGRGIIISGILLLIGIAVPIVFLFIKKNARLTTFTEQLPDALDVVSRSLRAGHSISSAIQMVGNELADPIAGIFKTAYEEQTLGLTMRDALSQMLERMQSVDLRLFVTAVNIHRDVGGNLADTLERLGHTIRERLRIRRQIKVYTAQGRLSGYILLALPIFMAVLLYFIAPDYLKEFIEIDEGKYAIGFAVAAQIIGFIVIKRLINIRI
jgi:tight adherence protein B